MKTLAAFACFAATLGTAATATAVPMQMAHQGRLFGPDGEPVEGQHTLSFSLYDASAGGAELWGEDLLVEFSGGYYAVVLGDNPANPIDSSVFDGPTVYLGLTVDDGDELAPRHQVVSAPYAIQADTASFVPWDGVENKPPGFADNIDNDFLAGVSCPDGAIIEWSDSSGTWLCGTDNDTTYTGADFALSNQSCGAGQVVGGINSDGTAICVPDANTTYTGADFALSNRTCPSNQFMTGISATGTPICSGIPNSVLRDYVNANCYVYFGWRDDCDGCTSAPIKGGRARGLTSNCATFGGDTTCQTHSLFGQSVRLAGINPDGDVDGNDKLYIGIKCE